MRTYSGHSSARASNELYRLNLSKGQTGLSVAFDLPTQTGYDPDHPLARGEVGGLIALRISGWRVVRRNTVFSSFSTKPCRSTISRMNSLTSGRFA